MSRTTAFSIAALLVSSLTASAQSGSSSVPLGSTGTVTLSRAEYDRLLDLASRRPSPIDVAPVGAVLNRADIRVRVDGSSARATMRIDGEVLRTGVVKVALLKGATLLDARLENRPLPVTAEGGAHVALVQGPGAFVATLETGSALTFNPGRGSFVLPVPAAGSVTATIDVPGDQTDVRLSSGLILRRASASGRTTIEATLAPGTAAEVSWSTHDSAPSPAAARDVRILADVKSIVSIGEADVRLIALVNATVVQGEPAQIAVAIPQGYEFSGATGASLERSDPRAGEVVLFLLDPAQRRHQFMLTLERTLAAGTQKLVTSLPAIPAAQRETGEVAIEGLGTIEVSSPAEMPGLRRIDVRELDPSLAGASRQSLLAAYRYQRTSEEPPTLELDIRRFADAAVLSAVAERGVATTLVTSEGRALTEVTLWIRNRAQPFMKVDLPANASILSAEVAGSPAKPVTGSDGNRVPLLRPGFRPDGAYQVSFIFQQSGVPFLKKGDMQMLLPKMDVPVNVLEWELFVPDQFRVDRFGGNAIEASLVPDAIVASAPVAYDEFAGSTSTVANKIIPGPSGLIRGRVTDESGGAIPGATVVVEAGGRRLTTISDANGNYLVSNLPAGDVTVSGTLQGFRPARRVFALDQRAQQVDISLTLSGIVEQVAVTADSNRAQTRTDNEKQAAAHAPSQNVQNLQRRAAGVLPVRMDIPRAGTSHRFVKPLVIDEETRVSFRYKRR